MSIETFASFPLPTEYLELARRFTPILLLALFWSWESWRPFFGQRQGRLNHAARNLAVALANTAILALLFGPAVRAMIGWTGHQRLGLLKHLGLDGASGIALGLVFLDGWMYFWHRANHVLPMLWRFHRTHHTDRHMDVTTATRFHLGEQVLATLSKLGLIPLLGLDLMHLLVYESLVVAVTQFHHADISLGRWDNWLRWLIVTPDMHKVHHSDWRPETNSNYSTVLSVWDRLFASFRKRDDPRTIEFGLEEFTAPHWNTVPGILKTPFVDLSQPEPPAGWDETPTLDDKAACTNLAVPASSGDR